MKLIIQVLHCDETILTKIRINIFIGKKLFNLQNLNRQDLLHTVLLRATPFFLDHFLSSNLAKKILRTKFILSPLGKRQGVLTKIRTQYLLPFDPKAVALPTELLTQDKEARGGFRFWVQNIREASS
jgi:hypothetical protein